MIVTANRTCVLLANEDMITQRINTHLAGAYCAALSVGKHFGDGFLIQGVPQVRRTKS